MMTWPAPPTWLVQHPPTVLPALSRLSLTAGCAGGFDRQEKKNTIKRATAALTDGANAHPIGTYVVGQATTGPGIRRHPYSTNMAIDPITYADMAASGEVHNIGEIWCSTLWDMTWNIIQQTGSITNTI